MNAVRNGSPGWLPDEMTIAGHENLDTGHVARYDEKEDGRALEELQLLQGFGITSDSHVVDLGAGTGQFTLAAAALCARVVAVDVSPVMVRQLRANVDASRCHNVQVVQAGFLTYVHESPPADLVYSRLALHHLPDCWKAVALRRIRETVRPGGLLRLWDVVYGFEPAEFVERFDAWCASLPNVTSDGEWTRADVEDHIRDEHSTFTWLLESMIERAGFHVEDAWQSDDGIYASYVARAD